MKLLQVILIITEVVVVLLLVSPRLVESHSLARAIAAYRDDPSAQRKSELEHEQQTVRFIRVQMSVFIIVLLAANSAGLYYVSRRIRLGRGVAA